MWRHHAGDGLVPAGPHARVAGWQRCLDDSLTTCPALAWPRFARVWSFLVCRYAGIGARGMTTTITRRTCLAHFLEIYFALWVKFLSFRDEHVRQSYTSLQHVRQWIMLSILSCAGFDRTCKASRPMLARLLRREGIQSGHADEAHGHRGAVPSLEHEPQECGAQDLAVPAARPEDRSRQPGVGAGHDLCTENPSASCDRLMEEICDQQ